MINYETFEEYLGTPEYYEEMERWNAKQQRENKKFETYMRSNDFKFDLITVKQQTRKRGGTWQNIVATGHKDVHLEYFNRLFDNLEKHARKNRWARYSEDTLGTTCYFVYEGFKFERLLRPDKNGQSLKRITYLG